MSAPAGEAFDAFVSQVSHLKTKEFLKDRREAVLALHAQGGRGNLRTLKHAMWDFEKIGSQLESRHWSKEESVIKIMKLVMAITMEYRAGDLNEEDVTTLIGYRIRRMLTRAVQKEEAIKKSKFDLILERYPQVDFESVLLGAPTLCAILLRGEMDAHGLLAELDATSDYVAPGAEPLWSRAAKTFTCNDATCELIAMEVENAFIKRQFAVRGEFLLIAGIRLWFAEIGLISKSAEDIVAESKVCIDDLARDDRLETSLDRPKGSKADRAFRGYGYPQSETSEHRMIVAYYDEVSREQEEKRYPKIARELLDRLSSDPDGFGFDLAQNTAWDSRYWDIPVLASLPPAQFARTVFEASPEIQRRAIGTLHSRYDRYPVPSLEPERPWIAKVRGELKKLMMSAKPMTRYRLESLITDYIDPLLPDNGADDVAGSATAQEIE